MVIGVALIDAIGAGSVALIGAIGVGSVGAIIGDRGGRCARDASARNPLLMVKAKIWVVHALAVGTIISCMNGSAQAGVPLHQLSLGQIRRSGAMTG